MCFSIIIELNFYLDKYFSTVSLILFSGWILILKMSLKLIFWGSVYTCVDLYVQIILHVAVLCLW